jgi:hypothetical protein
MLFSGEIIDNLLNSSEIFENNILNYDEKVLKDKKYLTKGKFYFIN